MSSATVKTAGFVRQLMKLESNGWGDEKRALTKISSDCKVSFWTLNNILIGRAKTVDADVKDTVRDYLIKRCRKEARLLLHIAETAEKTGRGNDVVAGIADQIRALAAELAAAQSAQEEDVN